MSVGHLTGEDQMGSWWTGPGPERGDLVSLGALHIIHVKVAPERTQEDCCHVRRDQARHEIPHRTPSDNKFQRRGVGDGACQAASGRAQGAGGGPGGGPGAHTTESREESLSKGNVSCADS